MPSRILQTRSDGERQIGQAQMPAGAGPPRRTHAAAGGGSPCRSEDCNLEASYVKENARQRKKIKEKLLSFLFKSFSESGLFRELRPIQIKKLSTSEVPRLRLYLDVRSPFFGLGEFECIA
jgi:hypothetical protein